MQPAKRKSAAELWISGKERFTPQRKRQKEHQDLVGSLAKGDEVVTSAGILGRITALDDNYMVLNVGENTTLKFQRIHVHAKLPKGTLKAIGD